jgi:hypothetical protein
MKSKNTFGILALLLVSLIWFAEQANSQTVVYSEDFESVTTLSYTASQNGLGGIPDWDYSNTASGRLQFNIVAHSGNYAPMFDSYVGGSYSYNYLTLTTDMSPYAGRAYLNLSFYYTDFGDEYQGVDVVEVRGSDTDAWIQVFDLAPTSYPNSTWNLIQGIDLLAALNANGQTPTTTFQVRFTQYDNNAYSSDGIAIDDVVITSNPVSVYVADIVQKEYSNCNLANSTFRVRIGNTTGNDYSNFPVNLYVTNPNGTISDYSTYYPGMLASGTFGIVYLNVNTTAVGTYTANATVTIAGPETYGRTENFQVAEAYGIPWKEDFTNVKDEYWNYGNGFYWSQGNYIYEALATNDTLTTPSIRISKQDYYFTYKIDPGNFTADDTVFVQMGEACTGNYTNIDTVINDGTHTGRYNDVFNPYKIGYSLNTKYYGKNAQVRFVAHFTTGSLFALNEIFFRPGNDIKVSEIILEKHPFCGTNQYGVSVVIQNIAPKTQSDIDITLEVYGQTTAKLTGTLANAILFGEVDTLVMGTFDATNTGTYELIATAKIPKEDFPENNIKSRTFEIIPSETLPVILSSGFDTKNWGPVSSSPGVNFNTNEIVTDFIGINKKASFVTFKVGPVTEKSFLAFDYKIQSDDPDSDLGSVDMITVWISPGCEGNFIQKYFIDRDRYTQNGGYQTTPSIDLSAYLGQEIVVKIEAKNGLSADETSWIRLSVDNMHIGPADVRVYDINYSFDTWCGEGNASFDVSLQNTSNVKATNVPVTLEVTSAFHEDKSITVTIPEVLPGYSTVQIGPFDLSLPGEYQLNANVVSVNDYDKSNDAYNESTVIQEVAAIPVIETFNPWPPTVDWRSDNGFFYTTTDGLGLGLNDDDGYLYSNKVSFNQVSDVYTFKFGKISTGDFIVMDYYLFAYDAGGAMIGNYLRENDKIEIYLSEDCGSNWVLAYTIGYTDPKNVNEWQFIPKLSLSSYAGKELRAKIQIVKGNPTGFARFAMNSFQVMSSGDAGVTEVDVPQYYSNVAVCGKTNDQAMVVVNNFGIGTITSVPVGLDVVFANDTTRFYGSTGTIQPGGKDTIYIAGFSTVQAGNYELIAYTALIGDIDKTNNKIAVPAILKVQELATVPDYYDGTVMPSDWQYYETTGSGWTSSTDIIGNGLQYLATPLLNESDTALVTVQKLGPVKSGYALRINYNAFAFDNDGTFLSNFMRTGDKLEVQISKDCSETYTTIYTINSANHINLEEDTRFVYDLGPSYTGSIVSLRLKIIKGSNIGKLRIGLSSVSVTIPSADLNLASVFTKDEICGNSAESVYAVVFNNSIYEDISGFGISAEVAVDNVLLSELAGTYSGTLMPGKTDTVLIGTFDSRGEVEYSIDAYADYSDDVDTTNNGVENYLFSVYKEKPGNYVENFDLSPLAWKSRMYEKFSWDGILGVLKTDKLAPNQSAWAFSPKIGLIGQSNYVQYDYEITLGQFATGDKVELYVSSDCGANYTLLNSLENASNLSNFKKGTVMASLSSYSGKHLIFKFLVSNVNGADFQVAIDNFKITYTDVEVLGIVNQTDKFDINLYNPESGIFNYAERYITCGDANDSLFVVVENKGYTLVNSVQVTVNIKGKVTASLTKTLNRSLLPGQKGWLYMGTVNSLTPGLLDMEAVISVAGDDEAKNDRIGFSVTTQAIYDIPFDAFSNAGFNESLYWKYDVKSKMVNTLFPTDLAAAGLVKGDTAFAVSPKLNIAGTAFVYFDYTVANSLGEGHIIHDEIAEVLVSENCGNAWTRIWFMDVTSTDQSASGKLALDLSSYDGKDIRIMFRAIKGNSNGAFTATYNNIKVLDYGPVEPVLTVNGFVFTGTSIPERSTVTLSNARGTVEGMNYQWEFIGADTSYLISSGQFASLELMPYNSGVFRLSAWGLSKTYMNTSDVNISVEAFLAAPVLYVEGQSYPAAGSTICEGREIELGVSNKQFGSINSYKWMFANADTSYTVKTGIIAGSLPATKLVLKSYNTGTFTLNAWDSNLPSDVNTAQVSLVVDPLPTLPVIMGHTEVVTNVQTTDYMAMADNVDNYTWNITGTGQIVGQDMATVYWPETGYIGMAVVEAMGENACGLGPKASMNVYVNFLNPVIGNSMDKTMVKKENTNTVTEEFSISAYPNPTTGKFLLSLPEGTEAARVFIKSSFGNEVQQMQIIGDKVNIDISRQMPGFYVVNVVTSNKVYTQSIILE